MEGVDVWVKGRKGVGMIRRGVRGGEWGGKGRGGEGRENGGGGGRGAKGKTEDRSGRMHYAAVVCISMSICSGVCVVVFVHSYFDMLCNCVCGLCIWCTGKILLCLKVRFLLEFYKARFTVHKHQLFSNLCLG